MRVNAQMLIKSKENYTKNEVRKKELEKEVKDLRKKNEVLKQEVEKLRVLKNVSRNALSQILQITEQVNDEEGSTKAR